MMHEPKQCNMHVFRSMFGPSDTTPSWLGIMPGTIMWSSIKSQVVTVKVLGPHDDAVPCESKNRFPTDCCQLTGGPCPESDR